MYNGKNKSMSDPGSYRPALLLSAIYKQFEKLLNARKNTYSLIRSISQIHNIMGSAHANHSCITAAFYHENVPI